MDKEKIPYGFYWIRITSSRYIILPEETIAEYSKDIGWRILGSEEGIFYKDKVEILGKIPGWKVLNKIINNIAREI